MNDLDLPFKFNLINFRVKLIKEFDELNNTLVLLLFSMKSSDKKIMKNKCIKFM